MANGHRMEYSEKDKIRKRAAKSRLAKSRRSSLAIPNIDIDPAAEKSKITLGGTTNEQDLKNPNSILEPMSAYNKK